MFLFVIAFNKSVTLLLKNPGPLFCYHGHFFIKVIPHTFKCIQVRALFMPFNYIHLCLLEIVLLLKSHMFRIVVMLEDEATTQTQFYD